jgi:hypothetical protein
MHPCVMRLMRDAVEDVSAQIDGVHAWPRQCVECVETTDDTKQ